MRDGICKFLACRKSRGHLWRVRGSPLLRFTILIFALAAAGAGMFRITSANGREVLPKRIEREKPLAVGNAVPFRVLLSHPAASVEIMASSEIRVAPDGNSFTGAMEMDPENPHFSINVRWMSPPATGEHRFAKITLEPPGRDTFTHVFDADGDIDDFLELPLPTEK